jgi:hypothetical protein
MRMKWLKRTLLGVALVLFAAIIFSAGGIILLRGTPDFYQPASMTPEDHAAAARRAEDKLATINNYAADAYSSAVQSNRAAADGTHPPATKPSTFEVAFTDQELNALFQNWSRLNGWKAAYEQYVHDPVLIFRNNRVILAGKATFSDLNAVVSVHLQPRLTDRGELDLLLVRVQGGRLPLPRALLQKYIDEGREEIQERLPAWQRHARIDANGAANGSTIAAAMGKLALQTLDQEPAAPVAFLPMMVQDITVPVKITEVRVEGNTLTLSAELLDAPERAALLEEIREPYATETAAAE